MKTAGLLIAVTAMCHSAVAGTQPQTLAEKLTDEYAACAAYYQIAGAGLEDLNRKDSAAGAYAASETALRHASLAAREGRTEQMADEIASSRFRFYIKAITRLMDNKGGNISVFAGPPGQRCKDAIENPDAFRQVVEEEAGTAGDR